jgi:hypothetical protein
MLLWQFYAAAALGLVFAKRSQDAVQFFPLNTAGWRILNQVIIGRRII